RSAPGRRETAAASRARHSIARRPRRGARRHRGAPVGPLMTARAAALVLAGVSAVAAWQTTRIDPDVRSVLASDLRFSPSEFLDIDRGRIVRHTIPSGVAGEVAVVGGVRIRASKESMLEAVRDIERFKKNPDVLEIGRFSQPPTIHDLDRLSVDANDFDVRT